MNLLSLTPAAADEWWRLWTGHLVHWDGAHLWLNALAFAAPACLLDARTRRVLLAAIFAAAPAVSAVILTVPRLQEYRGASGLALALWAAAAVVLISRGDRSAGFVVAALTAAKLSLEASSVALWKLEFQSLPEAHVAGAVAGLVIGLAVTAAERRKSRQSSHAEGGSHGSPVAEAI